MWAKALGATVYTFSHNPSKEDDAKKLGADHFIVTESGFHEPLSMTLDLIVSTRDEAHGYPLEELLS